MKEDQKITKLYGMALIDWLKDYNHNGRHWVEFDYEQGAPKDKPKLTDKQLLKRFENEIGLK